MNIADHDVHHLLESLNRHNVKFLLVGGMAGVVRDHIRTTQDMGVWVKSDESNKANLILALDENDGVGTAYLNDDPLTFDWTSVAVGKWGFTLDMGHQLKAFRNVDFDACYERVLDVPSTVYRSWSSSSMI